MKFRDDLTRFDDVRPAKEGAATNINLVTDRGIIYSFLLTAKKGTSTPDLKVYVEGDAQTPATRRYYTAEQYADAQRQVTEARPALEGGRRDAADALARFQDD